MSADLVVPPVGQRNLETAHPARSEARPAAVPRAAQAPQEKEVTAAEARKVVAAANDHLAQIASELTFQLDDESGRLVVKLIDRNTREVLRQTPTKEALAIARALTEDGGAGRIVKANA